MKPKSIPQMDRKRAFKIIERHGYNTDKPILIGMRGYYRDSMGAKGKNDRGIYDDAIFLLYKDTYISFNANTDPSRYRKGKGAGSEKGMACLKPGVWIYKLGIHGLSKPKSQQYEALVQADNVTVVRDGNPDYEDTGLFGINIHEGSKSSTSSAGCQTIYPDQWAMFIFSVKAALNKSKEKTIPYVLIEEQG